MTQTKKNFTSRGNKNLINQIFFSIRKDLVAMLCSNRTDMKVRQGRPFTKCDLTKWTTNNNSSLQGWNDADVVFKFSCWSRNSTWQKTYNKTENPIKFCPLPRFGVSHKGENVYDELPETKFNPFFLLVWEYLKILHEKAASPTTRPVLVDLSFTPAAQGFIVRWLVLTEKTQLV